MRGALRKRMIFAGILGIVGLAVALALVLEREETADVDPPAEVLKGTRTVDLFFPASRGGYSRETREIVAGDHLEGDVRHVLDELVLGGQSGERALPPSTIVRNVFFDGMGEVTIDLSDHVRLEHPGGSDAEFATLHCLASTLGANFPGIDRVRLLVDGETVTTLAGHSDLTEPLRVKDYR
jgi:hypothetical protein